MNFKYILIGFICLLVFTFALNAFDDSKLQRNEFSFICHNLYSEKVWIDTCNLPALQNESTYQLAMKAEIVGIILSGALIVVL